MAASDPLRGVVRAVAAGTPVDWAGLSSSFPELRGRIEALRRLAALAAAAGSQREAGVLRADARKTEKVLFSWGPLQVLEAVGAGGFGDVYRAFDPVLRREVALKLRRISGEAEARQFEVHLDEARCLARVRHPNVLAVHGVETHDGRAGMWTDFIRGETLEQSLARGPRPGDEIVRVGRDLCRALTAVHDAGMVHGDIKTANAMKDADGRTILMDFGAGSDRVDVPGVPQGTPLAMAPEQIRGGASSTATDLYSLGVLLYRLATGRYPIPAEAWPELLAAHDRREIIPLSEARPDLPPTLARAIERALAEDPDDRPATAAELEMMLRASLDTETDDEWTLERSPHGNPLDSEVGSAARARALRNLPRPATSFVGRRAELLAVRRLLVEPGLVTLTGPGGVGKTRLALRVALDVAAGMPDGVVWVDLAAIESPAEFAPAVLRALEEPEQTDRESEETLTAALRGRALLLVLDNCEHVRDAVAALVRVILETAPRSRVLATSRESLGLPEERRLIVSSLGLPSDTGMEITRSEAVRLFVDRACRRRPGFVVNPGNASAIARIVRRVDGIPLAIELAAARVGAFTVEQIAERLEESFHLLAAREPEALPRQQTLRASIEWSYRLLAGEEAALLDRLSVFFGGFTLDAAEAACADQTNLAEGQDPARPSHAVGAVAGGAPARIGASAVLDLLEALVDRSLVQFDERGRYRLLEMVRAFARDRLEARGESARWRDRQLLWCRALGSACERKLMGSDQELTHARLEAENDNLRAALEWGRVAPPDPERDPEGGLHVALCLRRYWSQNGRFREGLRHYLEQLERARPDGVARGRGLVVAATFAAPLGQKERAMELALEGLAHLRRTGDEGWLPAALSTLGSLASDRGDFEASRRHQEEALRLYESHGNRVGMATLLCNLGVLAADTGDLARAEEQYERAGALFREIGDEATHAAVLGNLCATVRERGDLERARELGEESVRLLRGSVNRVDFGHALLGLAGTLTDLGELARAHALYLDAVEIARATQDIEALLGALEGMAWYFTRAGVPDRAVRLLGSADSLREAQRRPFAWLDARSHDRCLAALRQSLGEDRLRAGLAAGRALPPEAAVRLASSGEG